MTERSTVEILRAARERITPPEKWCRGAFAKDSDGRKVPATHRNACRWCALGAIGAEIGSPSPRFSAPGNLLERATDVGNIVAVNDGSGDCRGLDRRVSHKRVLAAYDTAIELAEASS